MATYDIVCTVVGIILIASIVILCFIVDKKDKAKSLLYKLLRQIMIYVDEAEQMFGTGKGEAKLDYVLTKVKLDCATYKINITIPQIVDYIEQVLATPRQVVESDTKPAQVVQSRPITPPNSSITS